MNKEDLMILEEKISKLSEEEKKLRDLYLRQLASGEMLGPNTGYPNIDKPWLQWYDSERILLKPNIDTNIFDYFMETAPEDICILEYYGNYYNKYNISKKVEKYCKKFASMGIKENDTVSLLMLDVPEVLFMWMALSRIGAITNLIKFDESPERIAFMNNVGNANYLFVSEVPFLLKNVSDSFDYGNIATKVITVPIDNEMPKRYFFDSIKETIKKASTNPKESLVKIKELLSNLNEMKKENKRIIQSNKHFMTFKQWDRDYIEKEYKIGNNDSQKTSIIVYTGGTTGKAKGVELTNKNLINMAHTFKNSDLGFDPGKESLNIVPPGPAYYLNATYALMCCGVKVNLISNFEIKEYSELINKYKPNIFLSGPILLKQMAEDGVIKDASFIDTPISGGDKLHLSEEEKINNFFKEHGSRAVVHQGYGESESTAAATYSKESAYALGSIGIPLLNVEIGVFDYQEIEDYNPETLIEKQYGEIGEICITGSTIMKGYKNNHEETNRVLRLHKDGKTWLHTDDLGYIDEKGRLFHCGRAKRMLTRAGTKVWLGTIEDVIKRSDYIYDCCCVKFDDVDEREVPVAFVVPNSDFNQDAVSALDECVRKAQPEAFVPKYYVVIDNIPYTEVNKKVNFKELEKENIFDSNNYIMNGKIIKRKNMTYKKKK